MVEKETTIISIPRKPRRESPVETSSRDQEVKIVETCSIEKKIEDIIERLEKDSYFDDVVVTSFAKDTKEIEKELHLSKIKRLTD